MLFCNYCPIRVALSKQGEVGAVTGVKVGTNTIGGSGRQLFDAR